MDRLQKRYSLGEEIFSAVTHGVGALLSVAALVLMLVRAAHYGDVFSVVSAAIFGSSLILLYTMSTLYHALAPDGAKRVFRIFDHTSIFLLITGTYTPYLLVTLRGALGWTLFGILWALTAVGIVMDSIFLEKFHKIEQFLFVAMGWCILFSGKTLLHRLALPGLILLFAGGLFYTGGILFYRAKHIRYMHPIWHIFVLLGSICQFFSIYLYVL